jgi:DNA-binding NtrC family response regulator
MPDASIYEAELPARLLTIDGSHELTDRLAPTLATEFSAEPVLFGANTGRTALDVLRGQPVDVVIADLDAIADLGAQPDERIGRIARASTGALVIVLAADAGISLSLAAMRAGAHDCVGRAIDGHGLAALIGELARRHGKTRCLTRSAPEPEPIPADVPPTIPSMRDLVMPMWRQEQRIIEDAIQQFAGNIAMAAAALELSPSTIYRKRQAWAEMEEKRGAA